MQGDVFMFSFLFLSALVFLFFGLVLWKKIEFEAPHLGLLSVGIILVAIALFNPSKIRLPDGTELTRIKQEIEGIKENLRPFALVDIENGRVIYSTFEEGIFSFNGLKKTKDHSSDFLFTLKKKPRFVEVRSTNGSTIGVSEPKDVKNGFEFSGVFYSYNSFDEKIIDKIVIEAFF